MVMAEDIPDIKSANPVPRKFFRVLTKTPGLMFFAEAWNELCPKYNALAPGDQ